MPDASVLAQLSALPGVHMASGVAEATEDTRIAGGVLPVASELASVLPWGGLRRGSTLAVHGSTSLLLTLLSEATAAGSWAAVIGMPDLGLVAASELGVRTERLALVPRPGDRFADVVAALLDGMDLVAVASSGVRSASRVRHRLSARARHRRAVLLSVGPWPGADVTLRYTSGRWSGAEDGAGYLRARDAAVQVDGRGSAARPVRADLRLPGVGGAVAPSAVGESTATFGGVREVG